MTIKITEKLLHLLALAALLLAVVFSLPDTSHADEFMWTWVSGADTVEQSGTYGIKGTPNSANIPGARDGSISWTDSDGNLWLFGGLGLDSLGDYDNLNDLWRYDADGLWTWMSGANTIYQEGSYGTMGTAGSANVPGARDSGVSWTDNAGNLWLFGGMGYDSVGDWGDLNDLWRYDADGLWTWMSGADSVDLEGTYGTLGTPDPVNTPGARDGSISWTDNTGNLWLFGGWGYDSAGDSDSLNDLWRYDTDGEWTWMSGADTVNQAGIYGIKGTPDLANAPGARDGSIAWTDSAGNLWLFGGWGYDGLGNTGNLNDLWRYDADGLWTWMSGADIRNQVGVHGTMGIPDPANIPCSRTNSISWTDSAGNLWLFGGWGRGCDDLGIKGFLSDMWRYDTSSGMWTWMSGPGTTNQLAVYGIQGVSDVSNVPGGRDGSIAWMDSAGNLVMFGGWGSDEVEINGLLNDLWLYELPLNVSSPSGCSEGYELVNGACEIIDYPPVIEFGPYLAAGTWPVLPTDPESAWGLDQNYNVLWTFSDDYASCSELCTHTAEYQKVGESTWTTLDVDTDITSDWYASYVLPIVDLRNATYALRFTVTDCAGQSTQSGISYFSVDREDNPPVIESGPYLAAGTWPVLSTDPESPNVLDQNYSVLWTFSDDYGSCSELCTHTVEYQAVGESIWTALSVSTDPTGKWYVMAVLPIVDLQNATTYAVRLTVTDCAGQSTQSGMSYFRVER